MARKPRKNNDWTSVGLRVKTQKILKRKADDEDMFIYDFLHRVAEKLETEEITI